MRRRPIRPLVLACATLAVSALGTGAADYTNLLARTDLFLSAFDLDPAATPSIMTGTCPTNPPIVISTNDVTLMLLWRQDVIVDFQACCFNRVRIVVSEVGSQPLSIGDAYLFQGRTNCLARLVSPLVNTPMPTELLESAYRFEPSISDVCFLGFGLDTNQPPERVFLVRNGMSCHVADANATNLVKLAEIVCDTLSPPAEGGAP